jgi:putative oxidoreductase
MFQDATALEAAGRLCIVFFFVVAGLCNLTPARIKEHIARMAAAHTPLPAAAFWCGIALQFIGCALLLAGWHAAAGVWCLIVFTLAATAIFHRFWQVADPVRRNIGRVMLLNNIGVLGGLFLLLHNVGG